MPCSAASPIASARRTSTTSKRTSSASAEAQVTAYYGSRRGPVEVALAPKSHREIDLPSDREGHRLERVEVKALFRLASYVVGRRADSGDLVLFDHLFTYIK